MENVAIKMKDNKIIEGETTPDISIVIPVYNEEDNIDHLCSSLMQSRDKMGKSYEVILIDDGSKDRSYE